jgi:hypothetical protein
MSVTPILERTRTALETGKWWTIPWWRDDKYYKDGFASNKNAETAFCELIRTFDAKWMLGQKTKGNPPFSHQIAIQLLTEGLLPFQFLYELGINLHSARAAGLLGDIERRLKNPKEYWEAAAFELKFLSSLVRSGHKVERNYPSGKGRHNCDFKISKGNEIVFLEVKRLKEFHRHNEEIIKRGSNHPMASPLENGSERGCFAGKPLSDKVELNKVLRRIKYAANNQIPVEGPGVVVAGIPLTLNLPLDKEKEEIVKMKFWSYEKCRHLSAIVFVESKYNKNKICHNIHIMKNPHAKIDISSYSAIEIIRSLQA